MKLDLKDKMKRQNTLEQNSIHRVGVNWLSSTGSLDYILGGESLIDPSHVKGHLLDKWEHFQ